MVQIETKEAVAQAEAILSVEGVDGCMIGPGDMALSYDWNLKSEGDKKKHRDAILHVKSVAESCGKLPGIATGVQGAQEYLKDGFLFVLCMSDGYHLKSGATEIYNSLSNLARRVAQRVLSSGTPITLEPMPANERRIVHVTLAEHSGVTTESIGIGEERQVVIQPS